MFSADTSHIATLQPSATSWRASSRPMPVPPPVMTAILPAKSFMSVLPCFQATLGDAERREQPRTAAGRRFARDQGIGFAGRFIIALRLRLLAGRTLDLP